MTATDSVFRKFGALSFPLDASTESHLGALDPARDILLDLFAAAITSELEPVWSAAVSDCDILVETSPVTQKLPAVPTPEALGQMKTGWPLLCVSRATQAAQFADMTLEVRGVTQRWDVDYILCPLALGNLLRIQDVLQAVGKAVDLTIEQGGHRAYRTQQAGNVTLPANVLGSGPNCCGFWRCAVVEMALGPASFSQGGPKYYACGLTLETIERADYLDDAAGLPEDGYAVPLEGATATFGLTESGDPSIVVRG